MHGTRFPRLSLYLVALHYLCMCVVAGKAIYVIYRQISGYPRMYPRIMNYPPPVQSPPVHPGPNHQACSYPPDPSQTHKHQHLPRS